MKDEEYLPEKDFQKQMVLTGTTRRCTETKEKFYNYRN